MGWKVEVIADSSGIWAGNGLQFASKHEAEDYAKGLMSRWALVHQYRLVEDDEKAGSA
jgi:hypothetical protein